MEGVRWHTPMYPECICMHEWNGGSWGTLIRFFTQAMDPDLDFLILLDMVGDWVKLSWLITGLEETNKSAR